MLTQVRIYTVNKGQMDEWLDIWTNQIAVAHARLGINIEGAWVNRPQNEFVWVRTFADEADMQEKMKQFRESPERQQLGDKLTACLAKMEVRETEPISFQRAAAGGR
ncbi:MAG: NIPSNAP family protein [Dehalococcoidia bacterium]